MDCQAIYMSICKCYFCASDPGLGFSRTEESPWRRAPAASVHVALAQGQTYASRKLHVGQLFLN